MDKYEFWKKHKLLRRIAILLIIPFAFTVLLPLDWWQHGHTFTDYVNDLKRAWKQK